MTRRVLLALAALALAAACARPTAPPRPAPTRLEVGAVSAMEAVHVTNPHDHQGKPFCQRCHLDGNSTVADAVALCAQCHEPSIMKHPYGVAAKKVPAALPLGDGQKILCHTCHDPHDVKAHRKGLRLDYQPLCAQCHGGHGQKAAPATPK